MEETIPNFSRYHVKDNSQRSRAIIAIFWAIIVISILAVIVG